jgi:hypothetical protein
LRPARAKPWIWCRLAPCSGWSHKDAGTIQHGRKRWAPRTGVYARALLHPPDTRHPLATCSISYRPSRFAHPARGTQKRGLLSVRPASPLPLCLMRWLHGVSLADYYFAAQRKMSSSYPCVFPDNNAFRSPSSRWSTYEGPTQLPGTASLAGVERRKQRTARLPCNV